VNLWIINHHALTPDMGGGTRHYDFSKELVRRGHKVTIIASSFHYAKYKEMKNYSDVNYLQESYYGIDFIWIKTPSYQGSGFARVKNMLSFMSQVIHTIPRLNLQKPDTIIGSSVHLFAVYAAYVLSKRYKSKFIMEVRDLWPLTLIDMGISKWHPFILLLGFLEKYLYKKADIIVTNLPKAHLYIKKLGIDKNKIAWISNGTTLPDIKREYKQKLPKDKFNVLYTGAHGFANSLNILIDVADYLKDEDKIHFTLVGDGALKQELIDKSKSLSLSNVTFIPSVSKNEVFDYLFDADLLYVGLRNLPIYRYGMSMNKVFDYMSVKKPILFVSAIEDNIIETINGGIVIKEDDIEKISESIKVFTALSKEDIVKYGENNFNYLKQNYTIKILVDKLEKLL